MMLDFHSVGNLKLTSGNLKLTPGNLKLPYGKLKFFQRTKVKSFCFGRIDEGKGFGGSEDFCLCSA